MSRLCLFTFNPHPSDTKEFVQEMQSFLQPILQKTKQYIFVREKKNKPEEHIHFLFESETIKEKDKIKQKIENKNIKSFIKNRVKDSNTDYKHAFDYLLVPDTKEDKMYYVGYVCKEQDCVPDTKGYSQEYITLCVNYYNTVKRNETSKIDNSWKHLKPNELHCYMEHYSKEFEIPLDDPRLVPSMKEKKISFNQITHKQLRITKDELVLANKDKVSKFSYNISSHSAKEDENQDGFYYKQKYYEMKEALKSAASADVEDDEKIKLMKHAIYMFDDIFNKD